MSLYIQDDVSFDLNNAFIKKKGTILAFTVIRSLLAPSEKKKKKKIEASEKSMCVPKKIE